MPVDYPTEGGQVVETFPEEYCGNCTSFGFLKGTDNRWCKLHKRVIKKFYTKCDQHHLRGTKTKIL